MKHRFLEGIYFGLGFLLVLGFVGIVSAIGFHSASEILPGTFSTGNFVFDGNVGIGTSNPSERLELDVGGSGGMEFTSNIDGDTYIQFVEGSTRETILGWDGNPGVFKIVNSGTPDFGGVDFVVDSNGNVGIGTTNPIGRLQVNDGNIILATDANYRVRFYDAAGLTEKCNIRPRSTGNCGSNGETTLVSGPTYDLCSVCY